MLKLKVLIIFAVMLISIYFIIGFPRSRGELARNLRNNIRLGADLRGGSHLTLQIHLQDAFNAEAQEIAARLRSGGLGGTIAVEEATTLSEADRVAVHVTGAPVTERFPGWATKELSPSEYRLSLEPGEAVRLRQDVVNQTLRVIEKKTNELGFTDATQQT